MLQTVADSEVSENLTQVPITLAQAAAQGVPVPFPAVKAETELCDNGKCKVELGLVYTDFEEGMRRTYNAFKHVFAE